MANEMLMPLSLLRQYSGSLDSDYEFATLDELRDYATGSPLSYAGQILYCKENDTLYKVNNDKTDVASLGSGGEDGTTYTPSIGEVTTVDSNELASATVSVNTETKEAVFNFAIPKGADGSVKDNNIKTYCLLSQLGITAPCTIKDIWDKMPSGSVVIVDADSSIVTDLDVIRIALGISDGDEVYGILTVVKLEQRTTIEFRRARTNRAMIPDTFIGYCKGSDCTLIQWREDVDLTDVTDTIDINSSGTKIPNVKAIYDDVIEGKIIDQTVIDTYGTEILKYPLGIWRIDRGTIADKFSDLPVKTMCGRIEITSINSNINENPWNSNWGYRAFNFESHNGTNYFRKLNSEYGAGIKHDTGWQKVCGTTVEDVGVTTITPVNSNITGNIEYEVKNGICYVSMQDLMSTISSTNLLISTTMPKPSINCTASSVAASGNIAIIYIDKNTTNLRGNFYTKKAKSDCSFSYPVAEN